MILRQLCLLSFISCAMRIQFNKRHLTLLNAQTIFDMRNVQYFYVECRIKTSVCNQRIWKLLLNGTTFLVQIINNSLSFMLGRLPCAKLLSKVASKVLRMSSLFALFNLHFFSYKVISNCDYDSFDKLSWTIALNCVLHICICNNV